MSDIAHQFTTTVLPGGRIEVAAPELPEGTTVRVVVVRDVPAPPDIRADDEAEILDDIGRIELPPRELTILKATIIDGGKQTMPVYHEDEE